MCPACRPRCLRAMRPNNIRDMVSETKVAAIQNVDRATPFVHQGRRVHCTFQAGRYGRRLATAKFIEQQWTVLNVLDVEGRTAPSVAVSNQQHCTVGDTPVAISKCNAITPAPPQPGEIECAPALRGMQYAKQGRHATIAVDRLIRPNLRRPRDHPCGRAADFTIFPSVEHVGGGRRSAGGQTTEDRACHATATWTDASSSPRRSPAAASSPRYRTLALPRTPAPEHLFPR